MTWFKKLLTRWLLADIEARLKDVERHFVTKRDADGRPVETLADVPVGERKEREIHLRGKSVAQLKAWAERTDGGRNIA